MLTLDPSPPAEQSDIIVTMRSDDAALDPQDPRVLEYVKMLQDKGNRLGYKQRAFLKAWEETEPYDHPWRAAQVATSQALVVVRPAFDNYEPLTAALEYGADYTYDELRLASQRYLGMIDCALSEVASVYRVGITLMREADVPLKLIGLVTALNVRQLKHIGSLPDGQRFDVLMGLSEAEDYWLPIGAPDYLLDELNMFENQPSIAVSSALNMALDAARKHITLELRGEYGNGRWTIVFFRALRNASYVLNNMETEVVRLLRARGYSWRQVAEITFMTPQGAHQKYGRLGPVLPPT